MTLAEELRRHVRGEVSDVPADLDRYSMDESIFSLRPIVLVAPRTEEDVSSVVSIARHRGVPITARGGGSSTAGQAIGSGIIVDFRKHFTQVLDISDDRAVVQPGVILSDLNERLGEQGRRFAPDPSSRTYCTIGGMVANNASGPQAYRYGATREHVTRMRVMLSDGSILSTDDLDRKFKSIRSDVVREKGRIEKSALGTRKNSSGYALASLLQDPPNYTGLLVGSEGTLALATEIELKTIPVCDSMTTAVIAFSTMEEAIEALPLLRSTNPVAIELIDRYIVEALGGVDAAGVASLGLDSAGSSLWVEWEGSPPSSVERDFSIRLFSDQFEQEWLWKLRSEASKHLHQQSGSRRPLRCIEDGVVPPENLGRYVADLRELLIRHDCDGAIFGHAGDAHVHVNPNIDVEKKDLEVRIERLMEEWFGLVQNYEGSISGEHGDGILRREFASRQWEPLLPLYRTIKEAFDPKGVFNPDKKIGLLSEERPGLRPIKIIGRHLPPTCLSVDR